MALAVLDFLDSDSDDEYYEHRLVTAACELVARHERTRIKLYFETVVPTYFEFEYKRLFRLSRARVRQLSDSYENSEFFPKSVGGRPRIPAEKAILIALSYVACETSIVQIADKFDVTESAAHTCLMRVLRFLQHISASVIVWPDAQRQEEIKAGFRAKVKGRSLPDVIGCIDGSHIEVKEPRESQDSYYNRKKFHSVVLQGICDHELKFLDVFVGHPGASHDARVLADSFFYVNAATKCTGLFSSYGPVKLLCSMISSYLTIPCFHGRWLPAW